MQEPPGGLAEAISLLPEVYATAVRLRSSGATLAEVGRTLGLDPAAVVPLLQVADGKLRELLLDDDIAPG